MAVPDSVSVPVPFLTSASRPNPVLWSVRVPLKVAPPAVVSSVSVAVVAETASLRTMPPPLKPPAFEPTALLAV